MDQAPSTPAQLLLLVVVVLPGITYQMVRARWRGVAPQEVNLGERVLRAVVASLVLDALYLLAAGPTLVRLATGDQSGAGGWTWQGVTRDPRSAGVAALLLFVVVPGAAALAVSLWQQRRSPSRITDTPTAWDFAFRHRDACFVRARLSDGSWVGGWYGSGSYATAYPEPPELFLHSVWRMRPDGRFGARSERITGLYLRGENIEVLEFLEAPVPAPPLPGTTQEPPQ